ncbi:MAG: formylglycine-generating enzyme family protein [Spirochaetes bacterium]|nr:formylglycine-generating enzyme family protein [Spirochaetota bacterium]
MAVPKKKKPAAPKARLQPQLFKVRGVPFKLIALPAGTYWMGSPETEKKRDRGEHRHRVTLTTPFLIGETPVTQALFKAVMGRNPSFFKDGEKPVEQVSWAAALEFCQTLSDRVGREFRLPTEAEWEYACRAGTRSAFHFGPSLDSRRANFDGGAPYGKGKKGPALEGTTVVRRYPANPWGLYDLHGNVWEWCHDFLGAYPRAPLTDPMGPGRGDERIVRGGSWGCSGDLCRCAARNSLTPWFERSTVGFRLAADL